jgi:sugar phosphate isomerase/epimerase
MKIGICVESTGLSLRSALPQAARWSVGGVQIDAVGDLAPDRLTGTARRELRNLLKTYNLELTAVNCPLRWAIDVPDNQQARIDYIRDAMTLAFDLGPRIVVVQCPQLPSESEPVRAGLLKDALLAFGTHGDRIGTLVALEIGFDPGEKIRDYLNGFDVGSLAVNYDPANMLLQGHDPIKNVLPLTGKIVHTHARDVRMGTVSRSAQEVPVGAGDIDWMSYIGTLAAIEYKGWVVVERQTGDDRLRDIAGGVAFLRRFVF